MKTKRKSLGQMLYEESHGKGRWNGLPADLKTEWRKSASRIRREVLKRELEKAEDDLGVRAIHGERLERERLMLESRCSEKRQAAVILGRSK